jgi:hypothetical protein
MIKVVIVSGACCSPNMTAFDEQVRKAINNAIAETEIHAEVSLIPVSTLFHGPNSKIASKLMESYNKGLASLPAILINEEVIFFGVPTMVEIKQALLKFSQVKSEKEK